MTSQQWPVEQKMFLSIRCSYLKHFMMENVLKPNKSRESCIRTPHCPSLIMINCWLALFICFPPSLYLSLNFVHFIFWHAGSQFPDQGSNPHPIHWKGEILTTGPLGKASLDHFDIILLPSVILLNIPCFFPAVGDCGSNCNVCLVLLSSCP